MSHYAVLVLSYDDQCVEDLLGPYDENLETDEYVDVPADKVQEFLRGQWAKSLPADASDEDVLRRFGDIYTFDADGNITSTYNPESRWDWWVVGGRWSGGLVRKDGSTCDECRVSELSLGFAQGEYEALCSEYLDLVSGKGDSYMSPEYYERAYGDPDTYARAHAPNVFRALVTPDGAWHEPGRMGWFGIADDEPGAQRDYMEEYMGLLEKYSECRATLVDCHI